MWTIIAGLSIYTRINSLIFFLMYYYTLPSICAVNFRFKEFWNLNSNYGIVIASERSEQAPSTCIYWNRSQSIKSLIFVLDIWCIEKKSLILMSAPQLNNEPARPDPTRPDHDAVWHLISRKPIEIKGSFFYSTFIHFIKLLY